MAEKRRGVGAQLDDGRRPWAAAAEGEDGSVEDRLPLGEGQESQRGGDMADGVDATAATRRLEEIVQRDAAAQRAIQEMLQRDAAAQHALEEMLQRDAAARRALQELLQRGADAERMHPGPAGTRGPIPTPSDTELESRDYVPARPPLRLPQEEEWQRAARFRERVTELIGKFQQQLPPNKQLEVLYFLKNGHGLRVVAIEPLAGGAVLLIGDVATVMVDVANVELVFQVTTAM